MAPAQSRSADEDDPRVKQAKHLVFLNVTAWLMMIPARPEMILRIANGSASEAAQILGTMTAGASAVEFFATPAMAKYSDVVGRKPVLFFCATVSFVFRLLDFFLAEGDRRSVVLANWLDRLFAGACFPAFFTILRASLSDVAMGPELAKHSGSIMGYAGIGVMFGPVLGAKVMGWTGNPKYTCLLASLFSLFTMAYVRFACEETLEDNKRKPSLDLQAANPLSFIKLLTSGPKLRLLALLIMMQSVPNDMHDVKMVTLKTKLGLSSSAIGNYMLGSGIATVFAGSIGKVTLAKLGEMGHSLLTHSFTMGALSLWATAKSPVAIAAALTADTIGSGRSMVSSADLVTEAVEKYDMGKGEIAGYQANLGNVVKIFGPVAFARLFGAYGQATPFFVAALFIAAAGAVERMAAKQGKEKAAKSS